MNHKDQLEIQQLKLDIDHRIKEQALFLYIRVVLPSLAVGAAITLAFTKL